MKNWIWVDLLIVVAYGLQHTLLTTKSAVKAYNAILPAYTWNFVYSLFSVFTLGIGFRCWQFSGEYIFYLKPGSLLFHLITTMLALSLFFFFYCFKYTTSFSQWLGVKQITTKFLGKKMPAYYRVRKEGVKRYIRFPHHTCLIVLFWTHPVMTYDTLFLAVAATIYLYLGTYHQDKRGLSLMGQEWVDYQKNTNLLLPGLTTCKRMFCDLMDKIGKEEKAHS